MKPIAIPIALLTIAAANPALARPVYAMKEGKRCSHCHINARGGGPRNPRGEYYAAHNHSFQGFDEAKVMTLLKPSWTDTVPSTTLRIGVGDVTGDGARRLVLLGEAGTKDSRVLTIRKWTGSAWDNDHTVDLPGQTDRMAIGKFQPGMSTALIVTSTALVHFSDGKFSVKPSGRKLDVVGSAVLKDGSERLLLREGNTPGENLKSYRVDSAAPGAGWLKEAGAPPRATETSFYDMKGTPEELKSLGVPDPIADGGILGIWDPNKLNLLFLYGVQIINQVEGPPDAKPEQLKLIGQDHHMTIVDPRSIAYRTLWASEKLQGKVLDATINDPRSAKRGLLVLTDSSQDSKSRTVYFYQLD